MTVFIGCYIQYKLVVFSYSYFDETSLCDLSNDSHNVKRDIIFMSQFSKGTHFVHLVGHVERHALFEKHQRSVRMSCLSCYVHQCTAILETSIVKIHKKFASSRFWDSAANKTTPKGGFFNFSFLLISHTLVLKFTLAFSLSTKNSATTEWPRWAAKWSGVRSC